MAGKTTCGPLYLAALEKYTGMSAVAVRTFTAGFVSGQAEKVYLGACLAAMFRPSGNRLPMVQEVVADVARRYGLIVQELETADGVEVWLCRDEDAQTSICLLGMTPQGPDWHGARGRLCGVPEDEIDSAFHERDGAGQRCD